MVRVSMGRRIFLLISMILCGCRSPAAPGPSVQAADLPPVVGPAVEPEPSLRVAITPMLAPTRVHVAIAINGPTKPDESLRTWSLTGPLAGPLEPAVRDA